MDVINKALLYLSVRCREKGSEATFATFTFLTPPSVPVVSVNCLGRCNKGPNIRILNSEGAFVEVRNYRSIEQFLDVLPAIH